MWGLKLEIKKSIRTKKFWAILIIMLLLYIPILYAIKTVQPYGREFTASEVVSALISTTLSLAKFFITILAMVPGATAVNAGITEGTLRVAISKPISRLGYIAGKFLADLLPALKGEAWKRKKSIRSSPTCRGFQIWRLRALS